MASEQHIEQTFEAVLAHRFHRECELALVERRADGARCSFRVNAFTANPSGVLHGGVLYAMLDVTAYLATVPTLGDGEGAVSHDVHVSVLRAAQPDETVTLDATILRRGRRLVFLRVEAFTGADRLIASAAVTKSIVPAG